MSIFIDVSKLYSLESYQNSVRLKGQRKSLFVLQWSCILRRRDNFKSTEYFYHSPSIFRFILSRYLLVYWTTNDHRLNVFHFSSHDDRSSVFTFLSVRLSVCPSVRTLYAKPLSVETSNFACTSHLYVD